jgi:hypothetical protein
MDQMSQKMAMMPPVQLLPTQNQAIPRHSKLQMKQRHQNLRHHKLKKFLLKSKAQPYLNRKNKK